MGTKSKYLQNSHPKEQSKGGRHCRVCANQHAIIRKYNLNMCRQCFRCYAKDIGFIKVGGLCGMCLFWWCVLCTGKGVCFSVALGVLLRRIISISGVGITLLFWEVW